MRPRPSREWVIAELERHGVRIVAGRRGTSDNAILYKKNATSDARAASIVAHAAVSAAHEQHTQQAAAAQAAGAGSGSWATGSGGASVGNSAGPPAAAAAGTAGATAGASGAAAASGLRESFTAELGGERNDALAAARRDSLGALLGEGMMNRRTSLDSLGFAASLLSSGALDKLGEMDGLETSALRRDMANASAIEGGDLPAQARRNSSLDLVRFLKSEIGLFDEDGAAALGAGTAGGVPGSISIAGGGGNDHGATFAGAGAVMQRRLSNAALQMSLGLGGLSRGIGMDELVASSNPTPGGAFGSAAMSRSASAMLGTGPLGGLGSGSSALAAVSGLGPNATPSQHYEMLKLHHMNLLQEIQETTMMMNLYQQQMLQEQQEQLKQQQLKQQQLASVGAPIGNMMNQVQASKQLHNASRGQPDPGINDQALHKQQQQQQQQQIQGQAGGNPSHNYAGQQAIPGEATDESAEESIRKLRAEIAERESKMKELTSTGDGPESSTTNDLKAAKRPRM